jgi:hypothetical protein
MRFPPGSRIIMWNFGPLPEGSGAVVQADVLAAIEGDGVGRVLDPPQRQADLWIDGARAPF